MRKFNEGVKKALADTRLSVAETAYNHATTAIGLFQSTAFPQACFFAITAIEEIGKARTLQLVQSEAAYHGSVVSIDAKGIERFLRKHRLKAIRAAASGLSVNHSALRRHGRHEKANMNLTSGVLFLAKSNQWMDIRNACIYTDVDLHSKVVARPTNEITGDHAYYFICMALEILAKESAAGFGSIIEDFEAETRTTDFKTAMEFEKYVLSLLYKFMMEYRNEFDENNLEFFTQHPQYDPVRSKIRENEVRITKPKREIVENIVNDLSDELEEPSDEKIEEQLPDSVSYDKYKGILQMEMMDELMDLPYFTNPNMHPDVKDLRKHVMKYVEID